MLGESIIVVGGLDDERNALFSAEFVDVHDLLEVAPLIYPLPFFYSNQILWIIKTVSMLIVMMLSTM